MNDTEDKEDVYEDALMEATVDESEKAATAAAEEKTTSANAEVPGSKAEVAASGGEGEENSDPTGATVGEGAAGVHGGPPANAGTT